jgi:hypothetical protein
MDKEAGMDRIKAFEQLARHAQRDVPPSMDVSHHVIYRIAGMEEEIDRPLVWLTLGSIATACVAATFSFSFYGLITDPMGALFQITPLLGH